MYVCVVLYHTNNTTSALSAQNPLPPSLQSFLPPEFDIEGSLEIENIDFTDIQIIVSEDHTNR